MSKIKSIKFQYFYVFEIEKDETGLTGKYYPISSKILFSNNSVKISRKLNILINNSHCFLCECKFKKNDAILPIYFSDDIFSNSTYSSKDFNSKIHLHCLIKYIDRLKNGSRIEKFFSRLKKFVIWIVFLYLSGLNYYLFSNIIKSLKGG